MFFVRNHTFFGSFLLTVILLLAGLGASAQSGTIRGFVYDEANGEPIIFTNVILEGTGTGAATDGNGFFSIAQVPVGTYTILVTNIEYDTLREPVTVEPNKMINMKLFMKRGSRVLQTVTVKGKTQERYEQVKISTISVSTKEISRLPSIGGEPDLAQYLQVLPGVIFTGDQGGQLYIRGGAPIHNKVLLDGMVVYQPFHSIGLFSVFETDIIRNVDVLTGGFNAQYGDRISAVVDITTRDGNKTGFHGKVSASPFLGKALIEGPIKKLNAVGGSSSYLITGKHSYLNRTSSSLYPYVNDGDGIPYSFTDVYGKISLSSGSGSKFNMFGFNFRDSVSFSDVTSFNWDSYGFGTNFVVVPGNSNILIDGIFAYSDYNIVLREAGEKPRTSRVNGFNLGTNFTYFLPDGDVKYGVELIGFQTDFGFFNNIGVQFEQFEFTTEMGAYVKYRRVFGGKFVFEPSLRLQYYASLGTLSPEPRLGMKFNASDKVRFKLAGGVYTQNLISTKSDRDVVNLFNGFLSGPDENLETPDGEDASNKLQRAQHLIGGVEYDVTDNIEVTVEPYWKHFSQLININRNKALPRDPDFSTETGDAYGIDFLFKYDYKRYYVWVAYSLGYVRRYDGEQTYPPHYDRRHNTNLILTYLAGKNEDWEISGRWNFGSGFPFTQTAGFYEQLNFLDGISTDYTSANGSLGILYDDENLNGGRLPDYHRFDFSVKKGVVFLNETKLDLTASVTNVYNRDNVFFFDRVSAERVDQLPILPALTASYSF